MDLDRQNIEVNASSAVSLEDAIRGGLSKVVSTVEDIRGAWGSDMKVRTSPSGTHAEWRACLRVMFIVE